MGTKRGGVAAVVKTATSRANVCCASAPNTHQDAIHARTNDGPSDRHPLNSDVSRNRFSMISRRKAIFVPIRTIGLPQKETLRARNVSMSRQPHSLTGSKPGPRADWSPVFVVDSTCASKSHAPNSSTAKTKSILMNGQVTFKSAL